MTKPWREHIFHSTCCSHSEFDFIDGVEIFLTVPLIWVSLQVFWYNMTAILFVQKLPSLYSNLLCIWFSESSVNLFCFILPFPRTPNCDEECGGPGQGILGPPDQFGCSQCECRPSCAPYNRDACIRDCNNRGGTFREDRNSNNCPICGCQCPRLLSTYFLNFVVLSFTFSLWNNHIMVLFFWYALVET